MTMTLTELEVIYAHRRQLDEELAALLWVHQDAVQRHHRTFPTAKHLASWVGACPGYDESAGINHSHRSPSGNRQMRRVLNQATNAAVKTKGTSLNSSTSDSSSVSAMRKRSA
jgi:transposase